MFWGLVHPIRKGPGPHSLKSFLHSPAREKVGEKVVGSSLPPAVFSVSSASVTFIASWESCMGARAWLWLDSFLFWRGVAQCWCFFWVQGSPTVPHWGIPILSPSHNCPLQLVFSFFSPFAPGSLSLTFSSVESRSRLSSAPFLDDIRVGGGGEGWYNP